MDDDFSASFTRLEQIQLDPLAMMTQLASEDVIADSGLSRCIATGAASACSSALAMGPARACATASLRWR